MSTNGGPGGPMARNGATPVSLNGAGRTARPRHLSPFFYGWWIVTAGFGSMAMSGALMFHAFGVYVVFLQDEFGWSRTTLAVAFALQRVESGLLGPIDGWLVDHFGPRKMMFVGIVIFGVGFMLLSVTNGLPMFYLAFLVLAVGAALGSFMPASVAVVNWFIKKRATALAWMMLGLAGGGLAAPLVAAGMETFGWRAFSFASGVIIMVIGLPLAALLRHHPEDYGWRPDGETTPEAGISHSGMDGFEADSAPPAAPEREYSFNARQALRTQAFWLIGIGHGLSLVVIGAVNVHFIAHVHESLGFSVTIAASMLTIMTVTQVVGQMAGGYLGDRYDKRLLIVVAMLFNAGALGLLAFAGSLWMVVAFAILNGIGFGARIPLTTALRADYFGGKYYGTITGFSSMVVTVGIIIGPLAAGFSYDYLGSYTLGFASLALIASFGAFIFMFTKKPVHPDARRLQPTFPAPEPPEAPSQVPVATR
ncbi:MAG: MFS transporter [Chloroflexi bacterium]|nr:MFS transporter [Chloroflexota bacterium]